MVCETSSLRTHGVTRMHGMLVRMCNACVVLAVTASSSLSRALWARVRVQGRRRRRRRAVSVPLVLVLTAAGIYCCWWH